MDMGYDPTDCCTEQDFGLLADAWADSWGPCVEGWHRARRDGHPWSFDIDGGLALAGDDPAMLWWLWTRVRGLRPQILSDRAFLRRCGRGLLPGPQCGVPVSGPPKGWRGNRPRRLLGPCDRCYAVWIDDPAGGQVMPGRHAFGADGGETTDD